MSDGCYSLEVPDSPALKEYKVSTVAHPLPLVDSTIVSEEFFEQRKPNLIARSHSFRLRKTRADYDLKLLRGGTILLSPASHRPPRKPICIGKVVGIEHYPQSHKLRVKWEFFSQGRNFAFLTKKIDSFVNKLLREIKILSFTEEIVEYSVFTVRVQALTRNQKQRNSVSLYAEVL